jgi:hypothetical protein
VAISSNALTLAQYAIMSNDPLVRAITFSLIDNGSVMARDIPFVNKQSLIANGVRWTGNLPTVDWVALNTEGSTTSGTPTPFQEQAYILRNYIDVDRFLVEDENQITDPRQAQLMAYLKAQAYDFNFKFINNTPALESDSVRGIRFRLDNAASYGIPTTNKIDAGGTTADMTQAGMTAATFAIFTEFIEQLLWSVNAPDGVGVVLYMNEVMQRRWATGLRKFSGQGGFATAVDQFGRTITTYRNAKIVDIGYKGDQSTRIITVTETATGAADTGSTFTSIYAVNYGVDSMIGWQFAPLQARDQGLLENNAIYRIGIDWAGGIYQAGHRAVARLYDLKMS